MSCRRVRDWLHRESDSLEETQLLLLDDHLAACERCRADREHLLLLRRAGTSLTVPPAGAREYNRAIARALLEGSTGDTNARRTRTWMLPVFAAAAAAALAAIVLYGRYGDDAASGTAQDEVVVAAPDPATPVPAPAPRTPPAPTPTPAIDIVEDGALIAGATTIARGDEIPADLPLRTTRESRVRLAIFRAVIAANSQIRWSPIERTLLLDRGTIDVDVDATHHVAHVVTSSFDVEVADAALTIEASAVRVHRGSARIVDRRGKLLAQLEAEGSWEPSSSATVRNRAKPSPRTSAPELVPESAAELLARARDQLIAKQYEDAERFAERALAIADSRREQADAQIFLADVAQAAGKLELAVSRYETVATKFAELPAAESALYAGARIELRRGRNAEAQSLLDRYLDRYPTGRYADDARRQRTSP